MAKRRNAQDITLVNLHAGKHALAAVTEIVQDHKRWLSRMEQDFDARLRVLETILLVTPPKAKKRRAR